MGMQNRSVTESILPNIMDIAVEHNLAFSDRPIYNRPHEQRAICPFHICSTHNKPEYHLYINKEKHTFKCFSCGEKGGVVRFIALLEGITEQQVLERLRAPYKNHKRKNVHPAERLNALQLKKIGFVNHCSWRDFKKKWETKSPRYIQVTMDFIWTRWQDYIQYRIEMAYKELLIGLNSGKFKEVIEKIKKDSNELGVDLLNPALKVYSSPVRPAWTEDMRKLAELWLMPTQKIAATGTKGGCPKGQEGVKNV